MPEFERNMEYPVQSIVTAGMVHSDGVLRLRVQRNQLS
jgi:hypothetical protein